MGIRTVVFPGNDVEIVTQEWKKGKQSDFISIMQRKSDGYIIQYDLTQAFNKSFTIWVILGFMISHTSMESTETMILKLVSPE